MPPRQRILRHATVTATKRISPELVRLSFTSDDLSELELPHTDHYIKIVFGEVTRTYSLRSFDLSAGTMDIDFVVHGDTGLAGPWAQQASAGDEIEFYGPGGAWHPEDAYQHFVLVGDESAAPAICAGMERLPEGATAQVLIEISGPDAMFEVPRHPGVTFAWVMREGAPYGAKLAAEARALELPNARTSWFVHGVAEMIKDLRRYLFVERKVPKEDASISGYWRTGMTEDAWQSSKREFVAEMEAAENAAS